MKRRYRKRGMVQPGSGMNRDEWIQWKFEEWFWARVNARARKNIEWMEVQALEAAEEKQNRNE